MQPTYGSVTLYEDHLALDINSNAMLKETTKHINCRTIFAVSDTVHVVFLATHLIFGTYSILPALSLSGILPL